MLYQRASVGPHRAQLDLPRNERVVEREAAAARPPGTYHTVFAAHRVNARNCATEIGAYGERPEPFPSLEPCAPVVVVCGHTIFLDKVVNHTKAVADHHVVEGAAGAGGEAWPEEIADLLLKMVDRKRILGEKSPLSRRGRTS